MPAEIQAQVFAATVPGCVHTDLLAAGAIPDPYLDTNELDVAWVGRTRWRYATTFAWSPGDHNEHDLVFQGLDTVAEVSLNGTVLGNSANMHRTYRYDAGAVLQAGANELVVTFDSAWRYGEALRDALGALPSAYPNPFNFIRKMACSFGWDWGLSTVTAGIWRPVSLESWSTARLDYVRPTVTVTDCTGTPHGRVAIDIGTVSSSSSAPRSAMLRAVLRGPGISDIVALAPVGGELAIEVPAVELWWPHTHGAQPLYDLSVQLRGDSGDELDSWNSRIGFRDVRWDTSADAGGSAFTLVINERPIFVRGVNWIPDDAFPTRVDRPRYAERLQQARDANVDLVRVWGGGIYESDDFYDTCDELGLLVWQDFLFACAAYAEEQPIAGEIEAEARDAVSRLMPHPSLALWNGNNENIWGWFDWGWQDAVGDRTWGKGYYVDVLPRIVAEIDPSRTYWPGSPYSGSFDMHPNDPAHGPTHIWDVWNERDYTAYREYLPRFVAEFGYQAPPTWSTLSRAVHDDPLAADSPGVLHHQKAKDGNGKLARGLIAHLPEPRNIDDWHYLTQVNQARALLTGIEHFRSNRGRCMGTVWWQLNDCWPVTSWALVDGDGRPKPAYFALRRAYADRLLTLQPRGEGLAAVLVNDTATDWTTRLRIARIDMRGGALAESFHDVTVAAYETQEIAVGSDAASPVDPGAELLLAAADATRATWWFAEDTDVRLAPAALRVSVTRRDDGYDLDLSSDVVVKDLCIYVDRLAPGATVSDAALTVLPGESGRLRIDCVALLDEAALIAYPVLRSVNDLGEPWPTSPGAGAQQQATE